jgi:hypothetical protein
VFRRYVDRVLDRPAYWRAVELDDQLAGRSILD